MGSKKGRTAGAARLPAPDLHLRHPLRRPCPEPAPPRDDASVAVYESLATLGIAPAFGAPADGDGWSDRDLQGRTPGGSDLGDHESAADDDGDIFGSMSTGGEMYPELSPPRSAQKQPFTRGTVPRGALLLPVSAPAAPPPLVRGDSVQKVDALKAEAVSLKRQASAGGGGALGLQAISKLREAKALEGAVRRSADPAVGAAVAERVMAKLERTASEQHIAAVSRATLTAADLADDALLGELAMLQAEDGLIADEGLTEELDRTAAEHWALLKDAVTAGGVAKFWQKEGLEGAVRKEVRSPAARRPPARRVTRPHPAFSLPKPPFPPQLAGFATPGTANFPLSTAGFAAPAPAAAAPARARRGAGAVEDAAAAAPAAAQRAPPPRPAGVAAADGCPGGRGAAPRRGGGGGGDGGGVGGGGRADGGGGGGAPPSGGCGGAWPRATPAARSA